MSNTKETTTNEDAMRAVMLFSGHSAIGSLRTAISQSRITVGDLVNALSIVDPTTPRVHLRHVDENSRGGYCRAHRSPSD